MSIKECSIFSSEQICNSIIIQEQEEILSPSIYTILFMITTMIITMNIPAILLLSLLEYIYRNGKYPL